MLAEDLIKQGKLDEALTALEGAIRKDVANPKLRVFLFQILAVQGNWGRASDQLSIIGDMDPMAMLMVKVCNAAISCELLREQVFAGQKSPLIFGEPSDWIAKIVQAASMEAQGQADAAADLRAQAFEAAPTTSGTIEVGPADDKIESHAFEWIADADERLGPMLEAIVDGKYYWIPYERIARIHIEKPEDLRDVVWAPCQFIWTSGGQAVGFIPTRYPGSNKAGVDDALRLARSTEFPEGASPLGHRLIATDAGEFGLLSIRNIKLNVKVV